MIRVIDEHHLQVGDRTWFGDFHSESPSPIYATQMEAALGYPFEYEMRQFIVRFESKWMVSVIWGSMTYSDNHNHGFGHPPYTEFIEEPECVEAGVLHADRDGLQGGGDPFSYLDDEQLNALLDHVSKLHTTDDYATAR